MSTTLTLHAAKRCAAYHWMRVERLGAAEPWCTPGRARLSVARRILHEVGHFLVAPVERRHSVNYGLGAALWDFSSLVTRAEAEAEDAAAMLLALALEAALVSTDEALKTFYDQGWSRGFKHAPASHQERTLSLFWANVARLNAAGLLVGATVADGLVPPVALAARVGEEGQAIVTVETLAMLVYPNGDWKTQIGLMLALQAERARLRSAFHYPARPFLTIRGLRTPAR